MTDIVREARPSDTIDLFFADNANSEVSERMDSECSLDMTWKRHPETADELLYGNDRFGHTESILAAFQDPRKKREQLYFGCGLQARGIVNEMTRGISGGLNETEIWRWLGDHMNQPLDKLQMIYLQKFRVQMLRQGQDRVGIAVGIEIRVPFPKPWFVKYANRLPFCHKFNADTQTTKKILRESMASRLPARILTKARDGFPTDMAIWLRQDRMRRRLLDMVTDDASFSSQYLPCKFVLHLNRDHFSGKSHNDVIMWELFALETWHGVFSRGVKVYPVMGIVETN